MVVVSSPPKYAGGLDYEALMLRRQELPIEEMSRKWEQMRVNWEKWLMGGNWDDSELREMIDGRKIDFEEIWKWSAKWGQCEIQVKKRWNSLKGKTAVVVVGNEGFQRKGKERFLSHTSRLKKNPSNHIDPIIMSGLGKYSQFFWCFEINPIISLAYSWKTTIPVRYIYIYELKWQFIVVSLVAPVLLFLFGRHQSKRTPCILSSPVYH